MAFINRSQGVMLFIAAVLIYIVLVQFPQFSILKGFSGFSIVGGVGPSQNYYGCDTSLPLVHAYFPKGTMPTYTALDAFGYGNSCPQNAIYGIRSDGSVRMFTDQDTDASDTQGVHIVFVQNKPSDLSSRTKDCKTVYDTVSDRCAAEKSKIAFCLGSYNPTTQACTRPSLLGQCGVGESVTADNTGCISHINPVLACAGGTIGNGFCVMQLPDCGDGQRTLYIGDVNTPQYGGDFRCEPTTLPRVARFTEQLKDYFSGSISRENVIPTILVLIILILLGGVYYGRR